VTEEKNLSISIGLSQMQPGERGPELVVERAARALAKSRKYGGNQVQAIVSTNV
jgi:PleD family two-component response regulator